MPAPLAANSSPTSAIGSLLAGGNPGAGADEVRARMEALASQVRNVGDMVDAIGADYPSAAAEVAKIRQFLKQIVVKVAKEAPEATASGSAVPTGGSMLPNAV